MGLSRDVAGKRFGREDRRETATRRDVPPSKGEVAITMNDQDVAYAMGFGDKVSRLAYEQERAAGKRWRGWLPAPYTTDRNRATELLPEGREWVQRAKDLTALEICKLAIEARTVGHTPRTIAETTSGVWLDGKRLGDTLKQARSVAEATRTRVARRRALTAAA